ELGWCADSAALRKEPTGAPTGFRSDVAATAKRALKSGEVLDGEGGFCVWGKQVPAARSLAQSLLPLGLAHGVRLKRDLAEGECLRWSDVDYDENDLAVKVRREMEAAFGRPNGEARPTAGCGPPAVVSCRQLVMRGLDPRMHRKKRFFKGWIAESGPAMTWSASPSARAALAPASATEL